jgi:hypothetical protein
MGSTPGLVLNLAKERILQELPKSLDETYKRCACRRILARQTDLVLVVPRKVSQWHFGLSTMRNLRKYLHLTMKHWEAQEKAVLSTCFS